MKAIYSSTYDPLYSFFIPIAAYSWLKLGVTSEVFMPVPNQAKDVELLQFMQHVIHQYVLPVRFHSFTAPEHKQATYTQAARLFGGTLPGIHEEELLITTDVDMAVFSRELVDQDFKIHVWGNDLVPPGQLAMCYVSMPKWKWRKVMRCDNDSYQQLLDLALGSIECESFRGNYWGFDQEVLWSKISAHDYTTHMRAYPGTQFASHRVDRDDAFWHNKIGPGLIDAHLWRPGYEPKNFDNIMELFRRVYPGDNMDWLIDYRNKFMEFV